MKIRSINLNEDGLPETVLAEIHSNELLLVSRILFKMSPNDAEAVLAGATNDFNAFTGPIADLFCRFYEDGYEGVERL